MNKKERIPCAQTREAGSALGQPLTESDDVYFALVIITYKLFGEGTFATYDAFLLDTAHC